MNYTYLPVLIFLSIVTNIDHAAADMVTGGSMTFNLIAGAFETNPSDGFVDRYNALAAPGTYDATQPTLVFGRHTSAGDTIGAGDNSIVRFRPNPIGTTASFNDLRAGYTTPTSPIVTDFGINDRDPIAKPHPTRNPQHSTFQYDPSDILNSASGAIGFDGATSFWYGVEEAIEAGAIWLGYGDLDLQYDATRAVGGLSGLYFTSNISPRVGQTIYDTTITSISATAATGATAGSLVITGDLFATSDFDGVGLKTGTNVGTFSLNAVSAVPEPSSVFAIAAVALGGVLLRRRARKTATNVKVEA